MSYQDLGHLFAFQTKVVTDYYVVHRRGGGSQKIIGRRLHHHLLVKISKMLMILIRFVS